jgi:hypothetical protein
MEPRYQENSTTKSTSATFATAQALPLGSLRYRPLSIAGRRAA